MKLYYALGDLIEHLSAHDREQMVRIGFKNPHSYRGYYEQLAFEPTENVSVGSMLDAAISARDKTFQGYKGGDFRMTDSTECWIANEGSSGGQMIGDILMRYMLGELDGT